MCITFFYTTHVQIKNFLVYSNYMNFGNHATSFKKMRSVFFFGVIIALSISMIALFSPFFYPIFWAAVIAVMVYPAYKQLKDHIKNENLALTSALLLVLVVIILPLILIATLLVAESLELYKQVNTSGIFTDVGNVSSKLEGTFLEPLVQNIQEDWTTYAESVTQELSSFLFESIKGITANTLTFIAQLFFMFYTLFYFLRDGDKMLKRLMHLSPLGNDYEFQLFDRFTSTVRATLKSTLIIGGIQGTLGGLLFLFTGIQGAFVWGVVMVALSLIPVLGSFIIWLPAALIMLALGNVWQGLTILLFGTFVISVIDNLLRPPLVGHDIQMHPLLVLFTTLGGLLYFGISGFVIGPVLAALYLSTISVYEKYYKKQLDKN